MYNTNTLSKPDYKNRLEKGDAINADIITALEKNFIPAVKQTKAFSRQFTGRSARESAGKVWTFLKRHITYVKDSHGSQNIKLPTRFIADQTGDCKSYSLTAASLLYNLGIPVSFRYANYGLGTTPTHVYVVVKDERGNDVIVDGVWREFNSEKKPNYKFDHKMNVYTLSGINDDIGWFGSKFLKNVARGASKLAKNIGKGAKKIGLAIPRRAFRTLVALNVHGLATKLARSYKRDPAKVKHDWEKLGGKDSALRKSVNVGAKKKKILGIGATDGAVITGIGAAPVAAAAVISAAAPILIALANVLKKGEAPLPGEAPDKSEQQSTVDKILNTASEAYTKYTEGQPVFNAAEAVDNKTAEPEPKENDDPPGSSFQIKPIYIVAGVALLFAPKILKMISGKK